VNVDMAPISGMALARAVKPVKRGSTLYLSIRYEAKYIHDNGRHQ
jgi:hypothetical protein